MSLPITLSILVVNHNTLDLLRRCLRSIYTHTAGVSFEVLVVDNASTDGSAEMVQHDFPDVRLIRSDKNLGFAGGNNLALGNIVGTYIWLLNSDAELLGDAAPALVEFLDDPSRQDVGIVGPSLIRPDGRPDDCWGKFPTFRRYVRFVGQSFFSGSRKPLELSGSVKPEDPPTEVEYIGGAALMIRRRVVERIGLMDANMFMFQEDMDWCYRARRAGFKVFVLPGVRVQHVRSGTLRAEQAVIIQRYAIESFRRYIRKHWNPLAWMLYSAARWVRHLGAGDGHVKAEEEPGCLRTRSDVPAAEGSSLEQGSETGVGTAGPSGRSTEGP